ncbi:MAG TPA: DUF5107 domain-containing protein, partial [Opitutaceae bacterium]|nr:DUF5107 domain-containing protein [Opitutaceae bacterium]
DKTNGYDLIYRQHAIKPALVGLAGPWLSGGIEFNWPQHHRPATYSPVNVAVEEDEDGSKTVWLSDHDPLQRMKGMHGVCLRPGRAVLELRVRAYNRTPFPQTFLWWANVATEVHEGYQSFFPPDVHYVADHAKRAMSAYPRCRDHYYGIDYGRRARDGVPAAEIPRQFTPPWAPKPARTNEAAANASGNGQTRRDNPLPAYAPNDLSWYANIPVPTSYMAMGSREDFFGGYDHFQRAGIVHIADHHLAPGKKQWTWGNHEFGYAWDRNLTTPDAHGVHRPYIELMAGVYTDNQPDFSFLQPGETKTWTQYWYPIREIGPAQHANVDAALSLQTEGRTLRFGVAVTRPHRGARLTIDAAAKTTGAKPRRIVVRTIDVAPDHPFLGSALLPKGVSPDQIRVTLRESAAVTGAGATIITYRPRPVTDRSVPPPATEPAAPGDIASPDQLYLTGRHLEQYRHATRKPEEYWREALRRDPGDARCNLALGRWHLNRGEFDPAERHLRTAIQRVTERNPNPEDGEAHYTLGLTLRYADRNDEAYAAFAKAVWDQGWQAAGFHALAEIDCVRRDWSTALDHLERALRANSDNLRARDLKVMVLRRQAKTGGRNHLAEANEVLRDTLQRDPLDWWARHLRGDALGCDTQTRLDLAHDLARAGFPSEAIALLTDATPEPLSGTAPLVAYTLAWLNDSVATRDAEDHRRAAQAGRTRDRWLKRARAAAPDYCFPARLEEFVILRWASGIAPRDTRAPFYLGNLLYDRRRYEEAITAWETAVRLEPRNAVAWRNLGIAYFNVRQQPNRARRAYDAAFRNAPGDARLLYERDQLWKRVGVAPARRLRELERHQRSVRQRDDLTIELCSLYNLTGRPDRALSLLRTRRFQPWEGGEGQALGQHVRTHLLLGREALARGDAGRARTLFDAALAAPPNLGEARHPLANASDIHFWRGEARAAAGDVAAARECWRMAADFSGDFQEMSVRAYSELTYYSALSRIRLGERRQGGTLFRQLGAYARRLARAKAGIDYFATSLPTLLLFNDDLQARQTTTALFLEAQSELGLGRKDRARSLFAEVLRREPSHFGAHELLDGVRGARLQRRASRP